MGWAIIYLQMRQEATVMSYSPRAPLFPYPSGQILGHRDPSQYWRFDKSFDPNLHHGHLEICQTQKFFSAINPRFRPTGDNNREEKAHDWSGRLLPFFRAHNLLGPAGQKIWAFQFCLPLRYRGFPETLQELESFFGICCLFNSFAIEASQPSRSFEIRSQSCGRASFVLCSPRLGSPKLQKIPSIMFVVYSFPQNLAIWAPCTLIFPSPVV